MLQGHRNGIVPESLKLLFAILLKTHLLVAEKQLTGSLRLAEEVVDIDAYKDAYLPHMFQLFAQFEVAAAAEIANHGMKYVEVGHSRGDAAELVHQRRLYIVEKLGAHDAWC